MRCCERCFDDDYLKQYIHMHGRIGSCQFCRARRVHVFCSAGLIGVAMRRAFHLSSQDTLRAAWMVRNCSSSEFLFSHDRFTLSTFNAFPHLEDVSLLTYR